MTKDKFTKKDVIAAKERIDNFLNSEQGYERAVLGWIRDEYQKRSGYDNIRVGELLENIRLDEAHTEDYRAFWIYQILDLFSIKDKELKRIEVDGYDEPVDLAVAVWDELYDLTDDSSDWKELEDIMNNCRTDWKLEALSKRDKKGHLKIKYPSNPISEWRYNDVKSRLLDLDYDR